MDRKFADLGLGIVDASIVALAERLDVRRILTIDRDFAAVRMGKRWRRQPRSGSRWPRSCGWYSGEQSEAPGLPSQAFEPWRDDRTNISVQLRTHQKPLAQVLW